MQKHFLHATLLAIVAMMMFALPQHAQTQEKEAYVVKSDDGKTLTFYYDTQKATRPGTKWGIEEKHKESSTLAWAGIDGTPNRTITQAVIDPSFKEFRPKTTADLDLTLKSLDNSLIFSIFVSITVLLSCFKISCLAITNLQRKFDKLLFFYLFIRVGNFRY